MKYMDICFNSLTIMAPSATVDFILDKGFESCSGESSSKSPQNFSFKPLITALDTHPAADDSLQYLWINWIENASDNDLQRLVIEFESHQLPPVFCIDAVIECLRQEQLTFDLHFQYRLENEDWEGEITASSKAVSG